MANRGQIEATPRGEQVNSSQQLDPIRLREGLFDRPSANDRANATIRVAELKPSAVEYERMEKIMRDSKYNGPRDGSPEAILGVAKEYRFSRFYEKSKEAFKLTEGGDLACALALSTVLRDAGVKLRDRKPFPILYSAEQVVNTLVEAGWKAVLPQIDKENGTFPEIKPGYFGHAFKAEDGSDSVHSILVMGFPEKGEVHPVTKKPFYEDDLMVMDNTYRTREKHDFKWFDREPLDDLPYRDFFFLRPPNADDFYTPTLERSKIRTYRRRPSDKD